MKNVALTKIGMAHPQFPNICRYELEKARQVSGYVLWKNPTAGFEMSFTYFDETTKADLFIKKAHLQETGMVRGCHK